MKLRHFSTAILMALCGWILQSCTADKAADAADILSTVPNDVSLVAVINSQALLEKAGCTLSDGKITPGKDVENALAKIKDGSVREFVSTLVNGESGIDPSVLVVFREGYYTYLTGIAADPAKFKTTFGKKLNTTFSSADGVDYAANIAIASNRFWIVLNKSEIDLNDVRHFNTLSAGQSFLQNSYASNLEVITKDVAGWGSINGIMNTGGFDFQKRAMTQMLLQAVYEDPSAFCFSLECVKNEFKAEFSMLNAKGNNAKYLLPTEKVDVKTVASIGGTADMVFAIGVPAKLIDKLKKETGKGSFSMLGMYLQAIDGIDGTVAFACSNDDMKGVVTADNANSAASLSSKLSNDFDLNVTFKENILSVSTKSLPTGHGSVEQMASEFKNAISGVVLSTLPNKFGQAFSGASFMLYKEGDSVVFKIVGKSKDGNNFIMSLLNL